MKIERGGGWERKEVEIAGKPAVAIGGSQRPLTGSVLNQQKPGRGVFWPSMALWWSPLAFLWPPPWISLPSSPFSLFLFPSMVGYLMASMTLWWPLPASLSSSFFSIPILPLISFLCHVGLGLVWFVMEAYQTVPPAGWHGSQFYVPCYGLFKCTIP